MDLGAVLVRLPEMGRFLTVDELLADLGRLAKEHPTIARMREVGASTLGEPIPVLSIGDGPRSALLVGCPHPNEPVGAMVIHALARLLCDDAALRDGLGYTWHLLPSVDPDGTRLNEGWFAGPRTPSAYARGFYRPPSEAQVEWTFPISYKRHAFDRPMPETRALMRVIDEVAPDLMASLHNAGFGGVYYYLSRPAPPLYPTLHAIPAGEGLPLHLGEPEVPWAEALAPAIFPSITIPDAYDYAEANGADPLIGLAGDSSFAYAERHGTFGIVTEVAYFDDPRVNDQSPSDVARGAAILGGIGLAAEGGAELRRHLDAVAGDLRADSPFLRAATWWATLASHRDAERTWAATDPSMGRPATVAERFSGDQQARFLRLLGQGLLLRALEGEVGIGNGTPAIRRALGGATATFERWAGELEASLQLRVVPIRSLVAVQLGAVLAAAEHVKDERIATGR